MNWKPSCLTQYIKQRSPNESTFTPSASAQTKPAGYYSSAITVSAVTFAPANVLAGTTIAGTAGTMPNQGAKVITPGTVNQEFLLVIIMEVAM